MNEAVLKEDTLRVRLQSLEQSVSWTDELEGSVLSEAEPRAELPADAELPLALSVCEEPERGSAVYPRLAGGFSLDVSAMDSSALKAVQSFLSAVQKKERLEPFVASRNMYTLVLFLHDFASSYGNSSVADYDIGEPFFSEGTYQCPVRLFFAKEAGTKSFADIYIFLRNAGSGWKIIQLELL